MEEIVISENVHVYETLQDSRVFISSYLAEINENIHRNGGKADDIDPFLPIVIDPSVPK